MSRLLVTVALAVALAESAVAQGGMDLTPVRMPDLVGRLLFERDFVREIDISRPDSVDADIMVLRLFAIREIGGCEGTDRECLTHYALLLGVGGLPSAYAVYDLGAVGEITDARWVTSPRRQVLSENPRTVSGVWEATLLVTVQNYPTSELAFPDLKKETRSYRLIANLDNIVLERLP